MNTIKKIRARYGSIFSSLIIGLISYLALYAMLVATISPDQYDLRVGQVSPITITASRDVEDTLATQQQREAAMKAVQPSYYTDSEAQKKVMENLNSAFLRLETVRGWEVDPSGEISAAFIQRSKNTLAPMQISQDSIDWLLTIEEEELTSLRTALTKLVDAVLTDKLAENREAETIAKICKDLETDGFGKEAVQLAGEVLSAYLEPNLLVDAETYEAKKEEAAAAVEPVIYLKGRNIVRSGEIVTRAQITMLNNLGMLKSNSSLDFLMLAGIALLLALLMMVIIIYLRIFMPEMLADVRKVALLGTIFVVTIGLCILCQEINIYLMPVTLGVMLTAVLLKNRLALIVNIALSVICGMVASGANGVFTASMFSVMLTSIVSGTLSVAIMRKRQQRAALLLAGIAVAASNIASIFAVSLINSSTSLMTDLTWMAWAAGSGIMAAVLCIGLQPALEWVFNLVTSAKLLELSNPNQPLIRRLILEASGTYHHSIIVANLSEAAADSIGANGLLARVGAYYHDVGKLKRPLYFKENQMGDNPHDRTDPMVSTAILTAHPRDGVALAQKSRMPKPILDIIEQHHGDTPVIYFYDRCVKQNGAENVDIADFRYAGPRPQTREAAIVMLADTVEAAARALPDPTMEKMDQLIRRLVRSKMDDGQLDDSPLTMKDLDRICKAFLTVLTGVFHHRVEYPKVEIPRKGETPVVEAPKPEEQPAEAPAGRQNENSEEICEQTEAEGTDAAEDAGEPEQTLKEPAAEKTEE